MTARLVVLASGQGTNLQALLDACARGELAAQIVGVISNDAAALALQRAQRANVPTAVLALRPWLAAGLTREAFDIELANHVKQFRPHLVVLAGWMLVLGERFLARFPHRVVNLHPALPGKFPGKDAIRRAWLAALPETGVMVHRVVPEVDAGPVIAVETVPLLPGETLAELETRMRAAEHRVIVAGVRRALDELRPVFV